MKKQFIETGKIVGTHGIRGEMRVQPWSDSPDFLTHFRIFYLDNQGNFSLKVQKCRVHKTMVLLTVEGITDIESAEQMRNKVIFIDRNDVKLPQGSHFIEDLIGCEVLDTSTGKKLGELCNVSTTGANDVWHIQTENGKEYLIPAIPDVVDQVDIDARKVTITPLKGIFDDED